MKRNIGIICGLAIVIFISYIAVTNLGVDDSYTGEYITANKVYLSDGSINIVIYFNITSGTHFLIFEDWDASHSVQLSNLESGKTITVFYKDYFFGCRTIMDIEVIV